MHIASRFAILWRRLVRAAPHGRDRVPVGSGGVAAVPVVHGRVPVRRDQHVVPHPAARRVQAPGHAPDAAADAGGGVDRVLPFVDRDPLLYLPRDLGHLPADGPPKNSRYGSIVALADDLHPRALLPLRFESQVVLRFVLTTVSEVVLKEQ